MCYWKYVFIPWDTSIHTCSYKKTWSVFSQKSYFWHKLMKTYSEISIHIYCRTLEETLSQVDINRYQYLMEIRNSWKPIQEYKNIFLLRFFNKHFHAWTFITINKYKYYSYLMDKLDTDHSYIYIYILMLTTGALCIVIPGAQYL